jgi:hypothetical protein
MWWPWLVLIGIGLLLEWAEQHWQRARKAKAGGDTVPTRSFEC